MPRLRHLFSGEQRHHTVNSWATDLVVEMKKGGGREVLRILTRPWSEDSSTPSEIPGKPTGRNKRRTNKAGSKGKGSTAQQRRTNQTGGKRGASVEKPDTSLARQFKHPEHQLKGSNQIVRTKSLGSNGYARQSKRSERKR